MRNRFLIQDQDSWAGGSSGSLKQIKTPKVLALGGVPCQYAEHKCQGIYHCDQLDMDLLSGCERFDYADDDGGKKNLWEAERKVNEQQSSSTALRAAAYDVVHSMLYHTH
jgi:hypothetical protein